MRHLGIRPFYWGMSLSEKKQIIIGFFIFLCDVLFGLFSERLSDFWWTLGVGCILLQVILWFVFVCLRSK